MRDRLSMVWVLVQERMPLNAIASLPLPHVTPQSSPRRITPGRRAGGPKQNVHAKVLGQLDERFRGEAQVHLVYLQDQQKLQGSQLARALSTSKELWSQTSSHFEVGTEGFHEHDNALP